MLRECMMPPTISTDFAVLNGSAQPKTSTEATDTSSSLPPIDTSSLNGALIAANQLHTTPPQSAVDSALPQHRRQSSSSHSQTHTQPNHVHPKTSDNTLRVPQAPTVHRRSSPARYTHPQPTLGASSKPVPPPLTHRHTLEVPRPSDAVARTSRDLSGLGTPEDSTAANARASNVGRVRRTTLNLGRRHTRSVHSELHLDDVPPDEDAARWAEIIKQRRASKRRRKEEEDEDRVVVGTKVDQNHVNYVTAYNMLTGIRFTVSRINAKLDRDLTDADFTAAQKFSFDVTGNELTPSAKYDFKFKDYAPWVFRHLRATFRLDPADYLVSLTSKYILSELGSPGKSGSFFYFSRDYKYIIKTIHHAEHKALRKVLKDYYDHVQANPNTLLSQFYGLHRVKIPYGRKIHFVVMNNLFPPHRDIHRTFDLKGSTIGRDFKEEALAEHPRATLKDLNWLRRNMHLEFGPLKKQVFVEQIEKDVELLKKLRIMDYSLLVGIHDLSKGNEENLRDKTLQVFQPHADDGAEESSSAGQLMRTPSTAENVRRVHELRQKVKSQKPVPMGSSNAKLPDELPDDRATERRNFYFYSDDGGFRATHENNDAGDAVYYLGIIDCLTKYNLVKRSEHFFKALVNPDSEISAVPPDRYGNRFVRFISSITVSEEKAGPEKEIEGQAPDRIRNTTEASDGQTLPVVEEAAEVSSVGGRSGREASAVRSPERTVAKEEVADHGSERQ